MYVTRRLSQLLQSPEALEAPPDGPNSGYLVIQDKVSDKTNFQYFGKLPFPQNKELTIQYPFQILYSRDSCHQKVFLIPVLNQPLSSNRYYAIDACGNHKGKAFICYVVKDKEPSCFCLEPAKPRPFDPHNICQHYGDPKPRPLDPNNIYQQFQMVPSIGRFFSSFYALSLDQDAFPPRFFRRDRWTIYTDSTARHIKLDTAEGLDSKLRSRLPEFDFPLWWKRSEPRVVGKWYSPFIFVKEGHLKDQVERSMYYELTLEQRWERIFSSQKNNYDNQGNLVATDVLSEKEEVFIGESKAVWNEEAVVDGAIWFTSYGPGGKQICIGLRVELVERMKWEQKRGGWTGEAGEKIRVKINEMAKLKEVSNCPIEFGCYTLVERFNLKRMDESLVMSYDFKHFHQMKTKWEWMD